MGNNSYNKLLYDAIIIAGHKQIYKNLLWDNRAKVYRIKNDLFSICYILKEKGISFFIRFVLLSPSNWDLLLPLKYSGIVIHEKVKSNFIAARWVLIEAKKGFVWKIFLLKGKSKKSYFKESSILDMLSETKVKEIAPILIEKRIITLNNNQYGLIKTKLIKNPIPPRYKRLDQDRFFLEVCMPLLSKIYSIYGIRVLSLNELLIQQKEKLIRMQSNVEYSKLILEELEEISRMHDHNIVESFVHGDLAHNNIRCEDGKFSIVDWGSVHKNSIFFDLMISDLMKEYNDSVSIFTNSLVERSSKLVTSIYYPLSWDELFRYIEENLDIRMSKSFVYANLVYALFSITQRIDMYKARSKDLNRIEACVVNILKYWK